MNRNVTVTIIIIAVLIVLTGFGLWFYNRAPQVDEGVVSNEVSDNAPVQTINAKHQFVGGKHIVAGEVDLPTPCHILATDVVVAESLPEQVTINFTSSTQADFCAQVITPARFKVEFNASENASIKATWNGKSATLNLIPVGQNENLDDFELFMKG